MRTQEEISKEYGIKCAQLGDAVFRNDDLASQIEKLKLEIHNITVEAKKLDKELAKAESIKIETPIQQ